MQINTILQQLISIGRSSVCVPFAPKAQIFAIFEAEFVIPGDNDFVFVGERPDFGIEFSDGGFIPEICEIAAMNQDVPGRNVGYQFVELFMRVRNAHKSHGIRFHRFRKTKTQKRN